MPRFAIIGLGYWGPNLVRNFHEVVGRDLKVICDTDPARCERLQRDYPSLEVVRDSQQVFHDPEIDAVAIATPVGTHFALAKAALLAGKSVLVEKPLAASAEQAAELVDLARSKGLILMVDHVFIFSSAVRKIKELLDEGRLGKLLFIDSVRINLGLFQHDVNVVWDLAPHDLSIIDFLIGRLPKSVAAFGAAHTPGGLEDVAYINLDFGDGLIANLHVNWLSPVKIRYTMFGGADSSLVYNDLDTVEKVKLYNRGITVRPVSAEDRRRLLIDYRTGDVWSPHLDVGEPLRNVAAHFHQCVSEGRTPLTDGEAGLRVVRLLEAAQRSIKAQGGRITL